MNCGIDEIEFPDGTKEKFYYNGEEDRQAAIKFATICVNATTDSVKAKEMMYICFNLMINDIYPERITILSNGKELYLDVNKKALYNARGEIYVGLTDEEKKTDMSIDVLEILLKERAERKVVEEDYQYNNYDEDYDD